MQPKKESIRHRYNELGKFLKAARQRLLDPTTGKVLRVEDTAKLLGVTPSFVYQVEQGDKKPSDGKFGNWASIYGIRYEAMWKCMDRIPMTLVAAVREEPKLAANDLFSQLTEYEKNELIPFLNFVRWKTTHQTSESQATKQDG